MCLHEIYCLLWSAAQKFLKFVFLSLITYQKFVFSSSFEVVPLCINTVILAGFPCWKSFCVSIFITSYSSAWISSMFSKHRPLRFNFIFGNRKKSQSEVWWVGMVGSDGYFHWSRKLPQKEWHVGGHVMVQGPGIFVPFDWTFVQDIFPHPPQNIAIEVSIQGLSWWNKFLMYDSFTPV